ncbi:SRPBCC family protein [Streptomyces sp. GC420]|uniref:SRPBCC family protein n=1 Tax=Streptomyces sp. GC420 TaxID=2697568 RepID=UPI0028BDC030|nr:SRPBCC family protein [Streptomyces sp. GC420]
MADTGSKGPLGLDSAATDRLKSEAQAYLSAQAQRLLTGAGHKLGAATVKLNDVAEGRSPGLAKTALEGGRKLAEGKGPLRSAMEVGAGQLKDKVVGAFKGLGGGRGKKKGSGNKPTVIIEHIDVGVPVREAYDQWTQYQEFSTFAKGVKSVSAADETTTDWQAKIWWSSRSWKATTTEQVPDDHISWTSEGAKGSTKGVVSFHPLGENLTRILLVIEYYPSGFFEKTGNIWRAQGRRTRLDLKHFARFISFRREASDGWRGEIRDGEVVRSHEEAVEEEEARAEEARAEEEGGEEEAEPRGEEQYEGEEGEEEEEEEEEGPEGEYEEGEEPEGEYEYEDDEEYEDEPKAETEEEPGEEPGDTGYADEDGDRAHGRREHAGARSGR